MRWPTYRWWSEYRSKAREALEASNRLEEQVRLSAGTADPVASSEGADVEGARRGAELTGQALSRPFRLGFVGAMGVLVAVTLWNFLGQLSMTLTLLTVAVFIAVALDPIVERLTADGLGRGWAVSIVFVGLVAVFTLLGSLVAPVVVSQSSALVANTPGAVDDLLAQPWVQRLDQDYHLVDQLQNQINQRLTDQSFLQTIAGGLWGAGAAAVSGLFQTFTVLILTLYILANLPRAKQAVYAMVPASRRPRVVALSEQIMRRVGAYAIGQAIVASINGALSWLAMQILGVPYAAVLAVVVAFLGLIPMVGATLGGTVVTIAGLTVSPKVAIILLIYYIVYQQVENYLIIPRIMRRTVAVPGAVTVVAALAGATLLGMLGALLAIPVAAGLLLLYEEVLVPRQRRL